LQSKYLFSAATGFFFFRLRDFFQALGVTSRLVGDLSAIPWNNHFTTPTPVLTYLRLTCLDTWLQGFCFKVFLLSEESQRLSRLSVQLIFFFRGLDIFFSQSRYFISAATELFQALELFSEPWDFFLGSTEFFSESQRFPPSSDITLQALAAVDLFILQSRYLFSAATGFFFQLWDFFNGLWDLFLGSRDFVSESFFFFWRSPRDSPGSQYS
jgi:hypothetical protein